MTIEEVALWQSGHNVSEQFMKLFAATLYLKFKQLLVNFKLLLPHYHTWDEKVIEATTNGGHKLF